MRKLFQRVPLKFINYVYWFLLAYIVAALAWWYIELVQMNDLMTQMQEQLARSRSSDPSILASIREAHERNARQYIGEGLTFLLITIIVAIFVFSTVRKQIRYHLQQKNFMMAVTHELKTPIAVTKLSLETLKRHKLDEEKQKKIIGEAINETERLNTLCNNILLSSQLESGGYKMNIERFNCTQMVVASLEEFRKRYPARTFEWHSGDDVFVEGEEFLIRLVLNNLMENAVKYNDPSVPVTVALQHTHTHCMVTVADLGEGIPEAEKKKVFEKFYRSGDEHRRKAKGTGLGLYLSKKIVEDHKGSLTLEDNHPSGAVFKIILPLNRLT